MKPSYVPTARRANVEAYQVFNRMYPKTFKREEFAVEDNSQGCPS
jgi:hypothetical protein